MEKLAKHSIALNDKTIFITGAAGFIGSYLANHLLKTSKNSIIIGYDSLTEYNPIELKMWRLNQIQGTADTVGAEIGNVWKFIQGDLVDKVKLDAVFEQYKPQIVVNLAAQAGVRYSIDHPYDYLNSNIVGFMNILEGCRAIGERMEHLVYASSSSVYGGNKKIPFDIEDKVDHPVSLYAATKKSNELLAYSYSKLYNIPSTGLRFFTVYGPAGRTDMFYFSAITFADSTALERDYGFKPSIGIREGLRNFAEWYKEFYNC